MRLDLVRNYTYRLLALGFRWPSAESLAELCADEAAAFLGEAVTLANIPPGATERFEDFVREFREGDITGVSYTAAHEYRRLFVGPDYLHAPPYGSVYLDEGQVMGASSFDCLARYRQEGLKLGAGWKEPPDHVAIELEFMTRLSAAYSHALDAGLDEEPLRLFKVQRSFLGDHLGRWAPSFAGRLRGATGHPLYGFLGEFLPSWLILDQDLLQALAASEPREAGIPCA